MGHENATSRESIPLISIAIVIAQLVMAYTTSIGDWLTIRGVGRTPLFMAGLMTQPIRCILILLWKNSGHTLLLSTQVLDGIGGGFFSLVYPLIVADITFGTGRFNLVMGLAASFFGYVHMCTPACLLYFIPTNGVPQATRSLISIPLAWAPPCQITWDN
jgi:hypothetical protein